MNNVLYALLIVFLAVSPVYAHDFNQEPHKPTLKEQRQFDKVLDERLKLTDEQKEYIKKNRSKHISEMEDTIKKMEALRIKIRNVYMLGIPKFQADIKTAPMKAELALLKQNADNAKMRNRKEFESILTKEQLSEFELMKKEFARKNERAR